MSRALNKSQVLQLKAVFGSLLGTKWRKRRAELVKQQASEMGVTPSCIYDKIRYGFPLPMENTRNQMITWASVNSIRKNAMARFNKRSYISDLDVEELSFKYGLGRRQVRRVLSGESWNNPTSEESKYLLDIIVELDLLGKNYAY